MSAWTCVCGGPPDDLEFGLDIGEAGYGAVVFYADDQGSAVGVPKGYQHIAHLPGYMLGFLRALPGYGTVKSALEFAKVALAPNKFLAQALLHEQDLGMARHETLSTPKRSAGRIVALRTERRDVAWIRPMP